MVSRVSPPAMSIGLFRLHRGGSFSSIRLEVLGQLEQLEVGCG
jgi:hypothetical protein